MKSPPKGAVYPAPRAGIIGNGLVPRPLDDLGDGGIWGNALTFLSDLKLFRD
jgi:hypothetical protein